MKYLKRLTLTILKQFVDSSASPTHILFCPLQLLLLNYWTFIYLKSSSVNTWRKKWAWWEYIINCDSGPLVSVIVTTHSAASHYFSFSRWLISETKTGMWQGQITTNKMVSVLQIYSCIHVVASRLVQKVVSHPIFLWLDDTTLCKNEHLT